MTPLSAGAIALRNVKRSPRRSFCLILTVLLLTFFLYVGTVTLLSLSGGTKSVSNRLGADLMIVPTGHEGDVENLILAGAPGAFYLPPNAPELLKKFDGMFEAATPQTFLATLAESCCSLPLQLLGIDGETDFLIKPWLLASLKRELEDGEIIVGHFVGAEVGETLKFFNRQYPVVGKLEKAGMGFDSSVFMTRNTLRQAAVDADFLLNSPLAKDGSLVSSIMVRLKPGIEPEDAARDINRALNRDGLYAIYSQNFVNSLGTALRLMAKIVGWGGALMWLLAAAVISLLFSVTLNERKAEMAALRSIGASAPMLTRMVLTEVLIVCLYGAVVGAALGVAAVAAVAPGMAEALRLPFLLPSAGKLALLAVAAAAISLLTGLLAAGRAARRVGQVDIYEALRGN